MGIALGVCGLSFDDFCLLTPFEFQATMNACYEARTGQSRDMWECMRILAAVSVSPFSKGNVQPRNIIRLPWDEDSKTRASSKPVSKEEDLKRLKARLKQIREQH